MSDQNRATENKMGTMPVGRLLFGMSAPMMGSMLFQALYNIVDSIFVAKLSQDAMNAVSLAFPLQLLVMAVAVGTGVGVNALLSRSLGERKSEKASQVANTAILLFAMSAVLFLVIGLAFGTTFFRLQTENQQIIEYGSSYVHICMGCAFAIFGQMCFERLLQATGRTDLAMIPQVVGAVFNIIADPILIFGLLGFPRLEVRGAAIATVCGQCIAMVIGLLLNIRKNHEIKLSLKHIVPDRMIVKEIYRIGVPTIVMQSIGSLMNFGLNKILIGFTEAATAAFGAYYKIQSFVLMPIFGMNNALVPIVSYNYGAKQMDRIRKTARLGIITAVCLMSIGCLCFELIPEVLLGFFSPSEEMLEVGTVAFRTIALHFPVAGFCIVTGSLCQAMGKPIYTMITNVCRQLVVILPAAYLLPLTGELNMVWWAFLIAEAVSLTMNAFFLKKTFRQAEVILSAPAAQPLD